MPSANEQANSSFEGWAILEIFGHQRYAGYVSTQTFGTASMFRLDVPALEERERTMKSPGYTPDGRYYPAGSLVKEGPVQGYTKLFGVAAIYAMTPCSKEAALKAVEEIQPRPLMEVQVPTPETKALAAGSSPESGPRFRPVPPFYSPQSQSEDDADDEELVEEEEMLEDNL